MMTSKLAVAVLAAAVLAAQAAFLHGAVAAPLGSALGALHSRAPAAFEGTITVVAAAPATPAKRS